MADSSGENIVNGIDFASRTTSHEFNFPTLESKHEVVKPMPAKSNVKRETPPSSLLLPHLSESRPPPLRSSSLCDVFDASLENNSNESIDRNHQSRQSASSNSTQHNQCGNSILKNDNFSLSYSFRSQDTESNKSPTRDKILCKNETNLFRDDFDRVRDIYDNSPRNSSKSKRGASSAVSVTAPTNTASIFRQRSDTSVPRFKDSYVDRRESSKPSNTIPICKVRSDEHEHSYDERRNLEECYRKLPTNSSFEDRSQNQNLRDLSKRSIRSNTEQRLSNPPSPGRHPRVCGTGQRLDSTSSPNLLNSSFDVCLSDTDKFLGSLPLEGTFNSFGNDVGNEDTHKKSKLQESKGERRENGVNSLGRRRHSLVDGPVVDSESSSPQENQSGDNNRSLQRRVVESRKGKTTDHESDFPYKSDTLTMSPSGHESDLHNMYMVIRANAKSFSDFSFLLPGVKDSTVSFSIRNKHHFDLSPRDIFIAKRRLASAVCAFGGLVGQKPKPLRNSSVSSIFRTKCEDGDDSSVSKRSRSRLRYEQKLPLRYYENEDRLSWEVEENPPLEAITDNEEEDADVCKLAPKTDAIESPKAMNVKDHNKIEIEKTSSYETKLQDEAKEESTDASANSSVSTSSNSGETPKMKYRCKLCGQPKQNHTCPYQQSLQRSIGTMSYPALNAFDAHEPGDVAPPLSEMNNFVPGDDEQLQMQTPPRPKSNSTHDLGSSLNYDDTNPNMVTPETRPNRTHNRSGSPHSPFSSLSPLSNQNGSEDSKVQNYTRALNGKRRRTAVYSTQNKPRSRDISNDPLFLEPMEIKPEQFRVVTPSKDILEEGAYKYPTLPLTYGQRKKMSDSLFNLSKEVKGLTDECADVLREARETDSWDLAVAELMTQIIVVLHCPKGDNRLKGLQRYLMTLGISS